MFLLSHCAVSVGITPIVAWKVNDFCLSGAFHSFSFDSRTLRQLSESLVGFIFVIIFLCDMGHKFLLHLKIKKRFTNKDLLC